MLRCADHLYQRLGALQEQLRTQDGQRKQLRSSTSVLSADCSAALASSTCPDRSAARLPSRLRDRTPKDVGDRDHDFTGQQSQHVASLCTSPCLRASSASSVIASMVSCWRTSRARWCAHQRRPGRAGFARDDQLQLSRHFGQRCQWRAVSLPSSAASADLVSDKAGLPHRGLVYVCLPPASPFLSNLRLYLRDDFRLGLWTDRKALTAACSFIPSFVALGFGVCYSW